MSIAAAWSATPRAASSKPPRSGSRWLTSGPPARRVRGPNVIDVRCERTAIAARCRTATSPAFRDGLPGLSEPLRRRACGARIVSTLKDVTLDSALVMKRFYDQSRLVSRLGGAMIDQVFRVLGLGAGGHAKVIIEVLSGDPRLNRRPVSMPTRRCAGARPRRARPRQRRFAAKLSAQGVTHFFVGVGNVGDGSLQRRLFE